MEGTEFSDTSPMHQRGDSFIEEHTASLHEAIQTVPDNLQHLEYDPCHDTTLSIALSSPCCLPLRKTNPPFLHPWHFPPTVKFVCPAV
jgi:hypothetical protein